MQEGEQGRVENDAQDSAQPQPAPVEKRARRPKRRLTVAELSIAALVIAAAVLLRLYVYESDIVEGASMRPGLQAGDYILLSKLAYRGRSPRRFDVLTLRPPGQTNEVVIKRVVGLPAEWIWVWGRQVFVDEGRLVEPYAAKWKGDFKPPVWVPEGSIYVLGDNRDDSEDSRVWGPVPLSSVRGKALYVYFPFGRARRVR